eukprot:m.352378 g.352378  ORF g.352378 m.352378 type:complete len:78 (+) comp16501_c0_seq1:284-517(+)
MQQASESMKTYSNGLKIHGLAVRLLVELGGSVRKVEGEWATTLLQHTGGLNRFEPESEVALNRLSYVWMLINDVVLL